MLEVLDGSKKGFLCMVCKEIFHVPLDLEIPPNGVYQLDDDEQRRSTD